MIGMLFAVGLSFAEGSQIVANDIKSSCYQDRRGTLTCEYQVGKSLAFYITDIGTQEAGITIQKADRDGDYHMTYATLHGCVVIKPGMTNKIGFLGGLAFVSPVNGRVYLTWEQCQRLAE